MKKSPLTIATYEWRPIAQARYPVITAFQLVPLRALAVELEASYETLSNAAQKVQPSSALMRMLCQPQDNLTPAAASIVIAVDHLVPILLMARPRRVSTRLQILRDNHALVTLNHLGSRHTKENIDTLRARLAGLEYELESERQGRRADKANPGTTLARQRWGPGFTFEKMSAAIDMAQTTPLKKIAFELGISQPSLSSFLTGAYPSATAQAFYTQFGNPRTPSKMPGKGVLCALEAPQTR